MKTNKSHWNTWALLGIGCLLSIGAGCTIEEQAESRKIEIDGSSTVYPVSKAVVEEYLKEHPEVAITVSESGTGAGFERFGRGDTVISDASRKIKPEEAETCKKNGISYVELKIAVDGLTVVVNSENDWCDGMTVEQLKKIWAKGSEVKKWSDVDPAWPDEEIKLFGPGTESGTYDYFVEEICGKETGSRSDYEYSAHDNVLVEGIAGEKFALGYFGFAYYIENKERLKALAISPTDNPVDGVPPTSETVESGAYTPLSRPLFIYVNTRDLSRPEVSDFVDFYLDKGQKYVKQIGYVPLKPTELEAMKSRFAEAKSGGTGKNQKKSDGESNPDAENSEKPQETK